MRQSLNRHFGARTQKFQILKTSIIRQILSSLLILSWKKFVPRGTVSFKKACETIFRFKIYEISQKHQAMKNGGMRRQGPETSWKGGNSYNHSNAWKFGSQWSENSCQFRIKIFTLQSVIQPVLIAMTVFLYIWI